MNDTPRKTASRSEYRRLVAQGVKVQLPYDQWSELRYPGGEPEDGPARRNPLNGCVMCSDKDAHHYDSRGVCVNCNQQGVQS